MVSFVEKNKRKVSVGLFEVFAGGGRTIRRRRASTRTADPPAAPAPAAAESGPIKSRPVGAAPAATETPAPAQPPAPAPAPAPAPVPVPVPVPVPAPDPAATLPGWTKEEDEKLMRLKKENKSWKEIGTAFEDKFAHKDIKERFKELSKDHKDEKKDDEKDEALKPNDPQGEKPAETSPNQEPESKNSAPAGGVKDLPKITFEDGEELNTAQMVNLYRLHEHFEERKWVNVASKVFDKSGRRIDPLQLRDKLGDGKWADR